MFTIWTVNNLELDTFPNGQRFKTNSYHKINIINDKRYSNDKKFVEQHRYYISQRKSVWKSVLKVS